MSNNTKTEFNLPLLNDFETFLTYAGDNYTSRINAADLLSLENGLIQQLERVRESLANQWNAEDEETAR